MMQHTLRSVVLFVVITGVFPGVFSDNCDQEQLVQCTTPIKDFTDSNDLGFFTKKEDLEKLCPPLKDGLRCIDEYTYRCMSAPLRSYFNKLYEGTHSVIIDLCENTTYQEEFLRHQPCMLSVRKSYEDCSRRHQDIIRSAGGVGDFGSPGGDDSHNKLSPTSPEESKRRVRTVCCSFQEYLQCSKQIVLETCGSEVAKFTERYLDRMAFALIENHCVGHHVGSEKCADLLQMPGSSSINTPLQLIIFLLPLLPLLRHFALST